MATIEDLEREATEAEKNARKAKYALEQARDAELAARREPLKKLVERAHECLCQWNHTDGCSWHYEKSWNGDAHHRWLRKYDTLVNGSSYEKPLLTLEQLESTVSALETLKPKIGPGLNLFRRGALTP